MALLQHNSFRILTSAIVIRLKSWQLGKRLLRRVEHDHDYDDHHRDVFRNRSEQQIALHFYYRSVRGHLHRHEDQGVVKRCWATPTTQSSAWARRRRIVFAIPDSDYAILSNMILIVFEIAFRKFQEYFIAALDNIKMKCFWSKFRIIKFIVYILSSFLTDFELKSCRRREMRVPGRRVKEHIPKGRYTLVSPCRQASFKDVRILVHLL